MRWGRREFLGAAAAAAASGIIAEPRSDAAPPPAAPATGRAASTAVPLPLQKFIVDYMPAMDAPGMTLALATRGGTAATAAYGYVDIAARTPVTTRHRFEIGSITKSFCALVILQMQDEGRLDVGRPILDYLPWLPIETDHGKILVHHLLTHSSGMPDDSPLFFDEGGPRLVQAFKPGSQFHYSNWGFDVLGRLIESLERAPWAEVVQRRLFAPLGMADTAAAISSDERARIAQSYVPLQNDRPFPRHGALVPSPAITFTHASGSIASTPADMARYLDLLIQGGVGPHGRLVSEEGFKLFSTPHIAAEEFGPGASYGYGIAVDSLNGHRRLRHTGGMVSFMSSVQVDLDAGVGAFASINAQLGYRPNPVTQYALEVMRAAAEGARVPPAPPADANAGIAHGADFVGRYRTADNKEFSVDLEGTGLVVVAGGVRGTLQHVADDQFLAVHPSFALYPLLFGRKTGTSDSDSDAAHAPPAPAPVIEAAYGPEVYGRQGFADAQPAHPAPELAAYPGVYHSEDPWVGIVRVVQRRGQLWVGGVLPLVPIGERLFRLADVPSSPETVEFRHVIGDRAQVLIGQGGILRRIQDA